LTEDRDIGAAGLLGRLYPKHTPGWAITLAAMAVRNDNPMPYAPGNLGEARLLMETLCRDWTEELMKQSPDWRYLDDLNDWIEETWDLIADLELDESMGKCQ
jgi:hypothetical protein